MTGSTRRKSRRFGAGLGMIQWTGTAVAGTAAGTAGLSEAVGKTLKEKSGRFGTMIAKGGMNATHKKLVPSIKKTLTKKALVPAHEAVPAKMSATKKVVKKKPVPNMDNILNKKQNTRPDYH